MKKLSVAAVVLLVFGLASPVQGATDLSASHGFYEEMDYLLEREILQGYPDDTVRPDAEVTRAEAAIMIGRLKEFDGTQRDSEFTDVSAIQEASGFISAAADAGLIEGYPDGMYRPYETITRGDMAIILERLFIIPFNVDVSFSDVSENMEAFDAIKKVVGANIAIGYTNNTFRPNEAVTRAQFSAFLARGLEPEFKNDATIENSYLRDKTKTYVYDTETGVQRHVYNYVPTRNGFTMGYIWSIYEEDGSLLSDVLEREAREEYTIGYPRSEYYIDLQYPVEVGQTWYVDTPYAPQHEITDIGVTVETAYQTFTDAVEVTVEADQEEFMTDGYTYYMVEGFGEVKSVDVDGTVTKELIRVE
ncbi:S-layer homology domain-containing protein [Planococcus salinus]|uniref:S-layer homology domain-containing protein n=1 Tax=Planococcus salinus TaxID=1848460 RepID=A0A3M8P7K2_9BACL|nr:S-layer homology domain-containing protein [Planococcus salinus]RNF39643.1 S-layer homology domain-containing protein [Planococcus salinus]